MTARILIVDDEPDMEALLVQKFRRKISEGSVELLFARLGIDVSDQQPDINPSVQFVPYVGRHAEVIVQAV